jgi:hypothetical protein
MQYAGHAIGWRSAVLVIVIAVAALSVFRIARADNETTQQQDVLRLESRMTQLEQRLYAIENSVRSVEQQARLGSVSSRSVSQDELNLVRSQLQLLERRLAEDECGLAKIDERTLSPQRRKRSASGSTDQCRQNPDLPLSLP